MAVFEIGANRARLVPPMQPHSGSFLTDVSMILNDYLSAVVGEPLFVVRGNEPGSGDQLNRLALDVAGRPVVIDVVHKLDHTAIVAAMQRASAAGRLTGQELAQAYRADDHTRFWREFDEFQKARPFDSRIVGRPGPRLIMICATVEQGIHESVLRQLRISLYQVGVIRGEDGRRFITVTPVSQTSKTKGAVEPAGWRMAQGVPDVDPLELTTAREAMEAARAEANTTSSPVDTASGAKLRPDMRWAPTSRPTGLTPVGPPTQLVPSLSKVKFETMSGTTSAPLPTADQMEVQVPNGSQISLATSAASPWAPDNARVATREPRPIPPRPPQGLAVPPTAPPRTSSAPAEPSRAAASAQQVPLLETTAPALASIAEVRGPELARELVVPPPPPARQPPSSGRMPVMAAAEAAVSSAAPNGVVANSAVVNGVVPNAAVVNGAVPHGAGPHAAVANVVAPGFAAHDKVEPVSMDRVISERQMVAAGPNVIPNSRTEKLPARAANVLVRGSGRGARAAVARAAQPPASSAYPELISLAAATGAPTELVWRRLRRGERLVAQLRADGLISIPSGRTFDDPSAAAAAVAQSDGELDGWRAWRLGDTGPTLADAIEIMHRR